jgi:hypothetical protein
MENNLKRYWFEFDIKIAFDYPPGIGIGCGVNALSKEDALKLMDEKIFFSINRPSIIKVVENIDLSKLDQNHVIPNMKPPVGRCIWYPLGYD